MKVEPKRTFSEKKSSILKSLMFLAGFFLMCTSLSAQTKTITGMVVDTNKEALIGVSIRVAGTTTGTVTDIDGNYTIQAKQGDVLDFSYIGMIDQKVNVGTSNKIDVVMQEDSKVLQEAVVIGYGTAKAKDLTAPITTIKGDEVSKHLSASPMQGLQGKVTGVQIISTGRPGDSPKVRIRGIGNMDPEKQKPLFVVDGMFFDNIDFLNNNDIENISVLKDASSAAIYGVRAANGVVIVTTKKGIPNRKPQITYDGYVGIQRAKNVVKMANSSEYSAMMKEIGNMTKVNESVKLYGGSIENPAVNTDWFDQVLRTAPMHSHSVNIAGGGEKIAYTVGASYLNQEGILDTDNGYNRTNVKAKLDAGITDWFKVGANLILVNSNKRVTDLGTFAAAYNSPSIYPAYDETNKNAGNPEGFASAQRIGLSNYFKNPLAQAYYTNRDFERGNKVLPSFYMEFSALDTKLTFKTSFSQELSWDRNTKYLPVYSVSADQQREESELTKVQIYNNNWIVDNIATYRDSFNDFHNFTIMLGNSVRQDRMERTRLRAKNVPDGKDEYWYIHLGELIGEEKDPNEPEKWTDHGEENRGASFFGRVMYDYKGKYLLSATMRADGSSKFSEKWGYFPSLGLGWNITDEDFMKSQSFLDHLKLRANWGRLGNDKSPYSPAFPALTQTDVVLESTVPGQSSVYPGWSALYFFTQKKWELVEEVDFGIDFTTLNGRLSGEIDYYSRTTKDVIFQKMLPNTSKRVWVNQGEVKNSGIEVSLNWNDKIGKDFAYNVGVNMSTLKNKVTNLGGPDRLGDYGDYARVKEIGEPMDAFLGYEVAGIYQNQAEIDNDVTIANFITKPKPGDFRYKDSFADGKLDDKDRTILGSHIPTFYLGGNIGFTYKQFDFSTAFNGSFGHKILNQKRFLRQKQTDINFDQNQVKDRWTGEGSTNEHPSARGLASTWNYAKFNSYFVEKGDNFNIQNIQLGYTFNDLIPSNKSTLRVSFTAENPFSFFSYNGFTTNISDGIDNQLYPYAATYSIGVRLVY